MDDFLDALCAANRELNGKVPSESVGSIDDPIPRSAAYAVSEAERMLRDAGEAADARRVAMAWNLVLAGDIDDLVSELGLDP